jgi:hypothetical protein
MRGELGRDSIKTHIIIVDLLPCITHVVQVRLGIFFVYFVSRYLWI